MIQWMDNFQSYGTLGTGKARMTDGAYAEAGGVGGGPAVDPDPNAPADSRAYQSVAGTITNFRKVLTTPQATVGVAFRIWPAGLPGSETDAPRPVVFTNASNNVLLTLLLMTTGGLRVFNGAGTALGQTSGPVIVANAFQHVEIRAVFDAALGSVQIRVEGVEVLNVTNVNTLGGNPGPCAQVRNGNSSGATSSFFVKDYIIWDGTGTYNNDFIGSCSVVRLTPNADITLGGWTTSSGATGWNLINETPPNDSSFISAADPPPAPAQFSLTNLPTDVTAVRGLMMFGRMRKTDGGDGNVQMSLISGVATANGANRPITTAYTYWSDISETDPATSIPWLPSAVDAATIQVNRTV